jgi:uncharacterized lipoprotein YmbA
MITYFKYAVLIAVSALLLVACATEEPEADVIDLSDVVAEETAQDQF